jgi:hypothetical protein
MRRRAKLALPLFFLCCSFLVLLAPKIKRAKGNVVRSQFLEKIVVNEKATEHCLLSIEVVIHVAIIRIGPR